MIIIQTRIWESTNWPENHQPLRQQSLREEERVWGADGTEEGGREIVKIHQHDVQGLGYKSASWFPHFPFLNSVK